MTDDRAAALPQDRLPEERHIPLSTRAVVDLCTGSLEGDAATELAEVAGLLGAVLHASYRQRWQEIKRLYAAHVPAGDSGQDPPDAAAGEAAHRFVAELRSVLDAANYDEVPREQLERALEEESLFRLRLDVDLDDFAELAVFRRGQHERTETVRRWYGLRKEDVRFLDYERVVLYARYRDRSYFTDRGIDVDELPFEPGRAFVKMFQDVPAADIEMLLPNTDVRMRTMDKLVIGVPALVGGVVVATTKLAAALGLLVLLVGAWLGLRDEPADLSFGRLATLLGGLIAFGAYLWRQWSKFKNRRIKFMKTLSENLYFRTLADGPGVLFTVLDSAEEEDTKEALLAYRVLLDGPLTTAGVDAAVERRLRDEAGVTIDFEVSDALRKLAALGLATAEGERCRAVSVAQARGTLLEHWDTIGRSGQVSARR
jgi:hypothetical protein